MTIFFNSRQCFSDFTFKDNQFSSANRRKIIIYHFYVSSTHHITKSNRLASASQAGTHNTQASSNIYIYKIKGVS